MLKIRGIKLEDHRGLEPHEVCDRSKNQIVICRMPGDFLSCMVRHSTILSGRRVLGIFQIFSKIFRLLTPMETNADQQLVVQLDHSLLFTAASFPGLERPLRRFATKFSTEMLT